MKLNKRTLMVLGSVFFVIAAILLFQRYTGQASEQKNLQTKLDTSQATLSRFATGEVASRKQLAEAESQLAQAQLSLDETKASFPKSVESIKYDEILFSLAGSSNLAIVSLTASEPESKKDGKTTYPISSFTITVESKIPKPMPTTSPGHKEYIYRAVDDILGFANKITTGKDFAVATIDAVSISIPEPLSAAEIDLMTREIRRRLVEEATEGLSGPQLEQVTQKALALSKLQIGELTEAEIDRVLQEALAVTPNLAIRGKAAAQAIKDEMADEMAKLKKPSATIEISIYSLPGK
ncbi:MAG: hypothetical protein AAB834_07360 [Patescibacteria group bacterium]